MALVKKLIVTPKDRQRPHGETECQCSWFTHDDESFIQLDTFGSAERQLRGKVSQSIQLSKDAALELRAIIESVFSAG